MGVMMGFYCYITPISPYFKYAGLHQTAQHRKFPGRKPADGFASRAAHPITLGRGRGCTAPEDLSPSGKHHPTLYYNILISFERAARPERVFMTPKRQPLSFDHVGSRVTLLISKMRGQAMMVIK